MPVIKRPWVISGHAVALLVVVTVAALGDLASSATASERATPLASATRSWIAFQRDLDVWLVNAEGSETRLVARDARDPVWSPDGRHIAFDHPQGPSAGVYVKAVDGGQVKRLTRERPGTMAMPMSWSPNGRMIAIYRQYRRPGTCGPLRLAGDLYVMNADGSGVRGLTRHGQTHYAAAVWSPDSRRIAIVSCHRSPRGDPEIYVIEADGSSERRLTRRGGWDVPYGWSRDGRNVLVSGQRGGIGPSDLYLITPDGRRRRNLTRSSLSDEFGGAAWSPDESQIAFVRVAGGGTILVMSTDGRSLRSLNADTVPDTAPTWSPDGRRIAFTGWNERRFRHEVHVMNVDGTGRRNLTPRGGAFPSWSPR